MTSPLHPALFRYLRSVQKSDRVGMHGFLRRNTVLPRCERTVYRWQRRMGDHLLVVPNVVVERMGLRHAHVFVTHPDPTWLQLPYAVEAAWVTPDFCQEVLYLHCIVPSEREFTTLLASLRCTRAEILWSGTAWQRFINDEEDITLPIPATPSSSEVLRRCPFVIPVMFELWCYPNSLPLAWARIRQRLGDRVTLYLPRTRVHYANGKSHLTSAFRVLKGATCYQMRLSD